MKKFIESNKFKENLNTFPYTESHKNNITKEYETFLTFIKNKANLKDEIIEIDEKDIDEYVIEFLKTKKAFASKNKTRSCLKLIFELNDLEFDREKYPITNYSEYNEIDNKIITFDEFKDELEMLFNASDKLLCCMAFYNLLGNKLENARFAKMEDVDLENKKWKLYDGRIVDLSENDFLMGILKDAINQKEYKPFEKKKDKKINTFNFPDSYPHNKDNVYIFKTRNHPRSDNGLAPFSKVGFELCFARIVREYGNILNRNNLKVSGFLHLMYTIDNSPSWTIKKIETLKQEIGIKISCINIRVFFLQKYFPEVL